MPSIADNQYKALAAVYGAGLSMQDMLMKKYGGPTIPPQSEEDLQYTYFGTPTDGSMADREYAYYKGQSSGDGKSSVSDMQGTYWGAPPVPIDPLSQFPLAQLAVWVGDPGWVAGKPADGGLVAQIHNHGLVGGDLVNTGGADRPTYLAKDPKLNNQPSVTVAGAQHLHFDANDIPAPHWLVCICYCSVSIGTLVVVGSGAAANTGLGRANSNNQWFVGSSTPVYSGIIADTGPHLVVGQVLNGTTWCQVDKVKGPNSGNSVAALSWFRIGAGGALGVPSNWWSGGIAFAGVYTADPTLDAKWPNVIQFAKNCGVNV